MKRRLAPAVFLPTYARRELLRRRRSHLVIASGLALGIALVVVVGSVASGMQRAQELVLQSLYGLGTDMTVSQAAAPAEDGPRRPRFEFDAAAEEEQSREVITTGASGLLAAATVESIAGTDGVATAVGGLELTSIGIRGEFDPGEFDPGEFEAPPEGREEGGQGGPRGGGAAFDVNTYSLAGLDVAHPELGALGTSAVTDGRTFEEDDADAAVAVLDAGYAAEQGLATGDVLEIAATDYEVIGLATPDSGDANADVYLPLAQALGDAADQVSTVYVQLTDSQLIDQVRAAVTESVADAEITTAEDLADSVSGSLSTVAGLAEGVGRWLSVLVLASAFLVAGLLSSAAVGRRVREFGTLKALGWSRNRITGQVLSESMATGLAGGALGIALGLTAAWGISAYGPSLTAELSPAAALGASGRALGAAAGGGPRGGVFASEDVGEALQVALSAPVGAGALATAVALSVAGGLIAGAFAAWRAARLSPADALRSLA